MQTLILSNEIWFLALAPQWGGRIARLQAGGLDIYTPIKAESFNPLDWPRGGAYPLMPYSNRLRNARLSHAGTLHELPPHPAARPHTLHGVSHTQQWEVIEQSPEHAVLECTYEGAHWPWPVKFEQSYALEGDRLHQTIALTNLGSTDMPAGLGLHPYFQRHQEMKARFFVGKTWDIDEEFLPTGRGLERHDAFVVDASAQEELAIYGSDWDRQLHLEYPQGNLLVDVSEPLTHLVAFAPKAAPYVCLEPVSHLADAFNMPPGNWAEQGTQVLAPGQTLSAHLTFTWAFK